MSEEVKDVGEAVDQKASRVRSKDSEVEIIGKIQRLMDEGELTTDARMRVLAYHVDRTREASNLAYRQEREQVKFFRECANAKPAEELSVAASVRGGELAQLQGRVNVAPVAAATF